LTAHNRRRNAVLLCLSLLALAVSACFQKDDGIDLGHYLAAIDDVDAEWRSSAEAAFDGKEYLGTGDSPPAGHAIADVVRDIEANTRDLIAATQQARASAATIAPPSEAERLHSDYLSTLDQMIATWEDGLVLLETPSARAAIQGNPDAYAQFLSLYYDFQASAAAAQTRLDEVTRERNRLAR
jgi:hypothetical protein